jgi:hypothetical protein
LVRRCDPFRLPVEETGGFDVAIAPPLAGLPSGQSISAALRFPASLKSLIVALPCSQTPGGPPRQTIAASRCCPRYSYNEGSPINKYFEAQSHGFTTRCLRLKTPFLVVNQGSLPVGGQPFPSGLVTAGSQ